MKRRSLPTFSIIICLYIVTPRFYLDLQKYKHLRLKDYEIILVTEKNQKLEMIEIPVRIVRSPKKKISLGEKRDIGFRAARGTYCAYIDDDAYPDPLWLSNALKVFKESESIGAVGGPNLTPSEDTFWSKIGGAIYESYFTSGEAQYRFIPQKRRRVLELQGVNLIIKKSILTKAGGFHSRLNSGDDTKVCSKITALGYDVIYDPHVAVYHHRKPFPKGHLRQIKNMGTHRGFFLKTYPQTVSYIYFLPLLLTIGLLISFFLFIFEPDLRPPIFAFSSFMFLLIYSFNLRSYGIISAIFVVLGIILTHVVYAVYFLYGYFVVKKIEK